MAADPRRLARGLARQLVVYATGAPVTAADRAELDAIVDRAAPRDYGVRTLVLPNEDGGEPETCTFDFSALAGQDMRLQVIRRASCSSGREAGCVPAKAAPRARAAVACDGFGSPQRRPTRPRPGPAWGANGRCALGAGHVRD